MKVLYLPMHVQYLQTFAAHSTRRMELCEYVHIHCLPPPTGYTEVGETQGVIEGQCVCVCACVCVCVCTRAPGYVLGVSVSMFTLSILVR